MPSVNVTRPSMLAQKRDWGYTSSVYLNLGFRGKDKSGKNMINLSDSEQSLSSLPLIYNTIGIVELDIWTFFLKFVYAHLSVDAAMTAENLRVCP